MLSFIGTLNGNPWLRLLSATALMIGCIFFNAASADCQPLPEIDFSITKTIYPGGVRPSQGEEVTFNITGTIPFPAGGVFTLPGYVAITDTLPSGINLGGWVSPIDWECEPLTTTIPITGTVSTLHQLSCKSQSGLTMTGTYHVPLVVTATVETPDNLMLINKAGIGGGSDIITGTMPTDPNPGNNVVDVEFEVNPEKKSVEPPPPEAVPTLGQWGALSFSLILGFIVVYKLRKKKIG